MGAALRRCALWRSTAKAGSARAHHTNPVEGAQQTMHRSRALGWLTGLIVTVAVITVGCGGGDGGGGIVPGPAGGTATLNGTVVGADNVATVVPNAVVTVQGTGRSTTSDANGNFTLGGLPSGTFTVLVTTPQSEQYGTATAQVPLTDNATTTVNFAVLPLDLAQPEQILLDPINATLDLNGLLAYRVQVVGPDNQAYEGIEPTWVVTGGIGQISAAGVFTAQAVGSGQVKAYSGNAERTATMVVVAPRPPQIASFRVNPQMLPATGGQVFMSAAIKDGDGIRVQDVTVQILPAGGEPIEVPMAVTNPGSAIPCSGLLNCYIDASFGVNYQVPPNDNTPTPEGVQAEETYSVSLLVRDRSGMTSQSEFVDFVVQGIDPPPTVPGI